MATIHNNTPKDVQSKMLEALDLAVPPKRKPRLMDSPYYHHLLLPMLQSVNLEVTNDHQPKHDPIQSTSDSPGSPFVSTSEVQSNESFVDQSMFKDKDPGLYFFRIEQNMTMYKIKQEELNGIRPHRPRQHRKSLWTRFKDSARNFQKRILN